MIAQKKEGNRDQIGAEPHDNILVFPRSQPIAQENATQEEAAPVIPLATADQRMTSLPSSNGHRGLLSSFGPGLIQQPSLWTNQPGTVASTLTTYNKTVLFIRATGPTRKGIDLYIQTMMDAAGLKILLTLLDYWHEETKAKTAKETATVTPRQLLLKAGYARMEANSPDMQRKAYYCLLYLANVSASAKERRYVPENPQKPTGKQIKKTVPTEWKPFITLKTPISADTDGLPVVPDTLTYGLSEQAYQEMFSAQAHYFQLPTKEVLKYSAKNCVHELCLAYYLADQLTIQHFPEERYLLNIIFHAGLHHEKSFERDKNHLRFLLRVLYALEHLEIDQWIKREAQPLIDEILAIDLLQGGKATLLADATKERIQANYVHLGKATPSALKARKIALLKDLTESKLLLSHGQLLEERVKKMRQCRAVAYAKTQKASAARAQKQG